MDNLKLASELVKLAKEINAEFYPGKLSPVERQYVKSVVADLTKHIENLERLTERLPTVLVGVVADFKKVRGKLQDIEDLS